jgi:tryptophanyl-tRNA synthetase
VFKQYREADGRFHFKLTDAKGTVLLLSRGFEAPREAAQAMARIQAEGLAAVDALQDRLEPTPDPVALASALAALATPDGAL